ncbi:MAG: O-antigen ligase family protein [Hyphomicrobiaceae bacterium]
MARLIRDVPWPVLILIIGIIAPFELSLYAGSIRLPPHRIAILLFIVPAVLKLTFGRDIRMTAYDVFFFLYSAWTVGVLIKHEGFGSGGEFGGALALESFGGYVIARAYIRDQRSFEASIRLLFGVMFVLGMIAFAEAVSGQQFLRAWLQKLTGVYYRLKIEQRLGLTRATTSFEHPILYGTFCASLFAYAWFLSRSVANRMFRSGYVAGATYLSLSSAPLLCLMVQMALIAWERITRRVRFRATISVLLAVLIYIVVEMASSRSAIEAIVLRITIDAWTAYYRLQIWTYGLENVWSHPWLGIGRADWDRVWWMSSTSVDAFWLVIMMRVGIPAPVLLGLSMILLMTSVYRGAHRSMSLEVRKLSYAWTISILALIFVALTVHFWNSIHAYFFMLMGMGGWIADPLRARVPVVSQAIRTTPRPGIWPARPRPAHPYYAHHLAASR